ncbi:MAG TPA: SseB family protein [Actinoplanes sp.]|nr:SseB family protein [Actinoplanes sp.]
MSEWEPATDAERAMRDALRTDDQESYFRILAGIDLLLPVSADALAGLAPLGWGTWSTGGRTHVLAFTSPSALQACLADYTGSARRVAYGELADTWPNLEWWLAVNPGLPIEGYLPAWFVAQLSRGDLRLPTRGPAREPGRPHSPQAMQAAAMAANAAAAGDVGGPLPPGAGSAQPGAAPSQGDYAGAAGVQGGDYAEAAGGQGSDYAGAAGGQGADHAGAAGRQGGDYAGAAGGQGSDYAGTAGRQGGMYSGASRGQVGPGGLPIRTPGSVLPSGLPSRVPASPDAGGSSGYGVAVPAAYQPPPVPPASGSGPAPTSGDPARPQNPHGPLPTRTPMAQTPPLPSHIPPPDTDQPASRTAHEEASGTPTPMSPGGALPRRQPASPGDRPPSMAAAARAMAGNRAPDSQTSGATTVPPVIPGAPGSDRPGRTSFAPAAAERPDVAAAGPARGTATADSPDRAPMSTSAGSSSTGVWPGSPAGSPATAPTSAPAGATSAGAAATSAPAGATSAGATSAGATRTGASPTSPATTGTAAAGAATTGEATTGAATADAARTHAAATAATTGAGEADATTGAGEADATSGAAGAGTATGAGRAGATAIGAPPGGPATGAAAAGTATGAAAAGATTTGAARAGGTATGAPARTGRTDDEDIEPANAVERDLLSAADDGSTDAFLSTLLLATVLVPVADSSRPGSSPGESGFAFRTEEIDGERFLVVFTSRDRLAEHYSEPARTVGVKFLELIRNWPDPAWSFAVNPGTPVGAKYPGPQVIALANWATEAGLGADREEREEKPAPLPQRVSDAAQHATVMQKTVPPEQVDYYLERGYDRVAGFVHRANEVEHLHTPGELFAALGLVHAGTSYTADAKEAYVLRWPAYRPSLYRIPYGGQSEQALRAMDGWVIERPPFRGNGFAPGEGRDVIAEFKVDSVRLPHGAQLWRMDADGNEKMVAVLDSDTPIWRKVGEPDA